MIEEEEFIEKYNQCLPVCMNPTVYPEQQNSLSKKRAFPRVKEDVGLSSLQEEGKCQSSLSLDFAVICFSGICHSVFIAARSERIAGKIEIPVMLYPGSHCVDFPLTFGS